MPLYSSASVVAVPETSGPDAVVPFSAQSSWYPWLRVMPRELVVKLPNDNCDEHVAPICSTQFRAASRPVR